MTIFSGYKQHKFRTNSPPRKPRSDFACLQAPSRCRFCKGSGFRGSGGSGFGVEEFRILEAKRFSAHAQGSSACFFLVWSAFF